LCAQPAKLHHLGIRGKVSRSALADANEARECAGLAHPRTGGLLRDGPWLLVPLLIDITPVEEALVHDNQLILL
jgi:hypothetical protein